MVKVTLLAHTPNPEATVAAAAKLCYSPSDIDTIRDGLTPEKTAAFVEMLSEIGHESPIEHVSFTFGVEGISRACSHQLVRHRIASYSQKSQRYVSEDNFEYVIPPEVEGIPEAKEEFIRQMQEIEIGYKRLAELLTNKHVENFKSQGLDEKQALQKAKKKAFEDARFLLPNACETKIIVTMNARSLNNFFRHRCCNRAQWEIKQVADKMLEEVLKVAPNLFKNAGPSCVFGPCPEGKMTCGRIKSVREEYSNLKEQV